MVNGEWKCRPSPFATNHSPFTGFKSVRRAHQLVDDAGLGDGVAGVGDDAEVRLGPRLVQLPGAEDGADHVVAPLDDDGRDVADAADVLDEVVVGREEGVVHEVVALDAREGERELGVGELLDGGVVEEELRSAPLPHAPRARRFEPRRLVLARQAAVVGRDEVAALVFGDDLLELLPHVREDPARALLVEPAYLLRPAQEDAAQGQRAHALRVRLGVRERERAPPRAAEDVPGVDAELPAYLLDVLDQVPRRVPLQLRVRRALPRAALVEEDDAVGRRVEELPVLRDETAAGAAVQEDDGLPLGVTALLVIEVVNGRDLEPPGAVGLDRGVEFSHARNQTARAAVRTKTARAP